MPADTPRMPCVPRFPIPGVSLSSNFEDIPLGPGETYCGESSPAAGSEAGTKPATNQGSSQESQASTKSSKSADSVDTNDTNNTTQDTGSDSVAMPSIVSTAASSTSTGTNPGSAGSTGASESSSNNSTADAVPSSQSNNTTSGSTFQATITGYGPECAETGAGYGSCGFLGAPNAFQAAVSTYWNTAGLPGQCGTCWKLTEGTSINGDGSKGALLGTPPIVIMVDNTCAKDPSKPTGAEDGFQCNQNAQNPVDRFGSVTVIDLCVDTGAPAAFWGHLFTGGQTGGLAIAKITQVDCDEWEGSLDRFADWTKYQQVPGDSKKVEVKPGHS